MHEAAENVYDSFEFLDILAPPRNWHGKFSFKYGYAFLEREVSFQNDSDSCKLTFEGRRVFVRVMKNIWRKNTRSTAKKICRISQPLKFFLQKIDFYVTSRHGSLVEENVFSRRWRADLLCCAMIHTVYGLGKKKIRRLSSADFLLRKIF